MSTSSAIGGRSGDAVAGTGSGGIRRDPGRRWDRRCRGRSATGGDQRCQCRSGPSAVLGGYTNVYALNGKIIDSTGHVVMATVVMVVSAATGRSYSDRCGDQCDQWRSAGGDGGHGGVSTAGGDGGAGGRACSLQTAGQTSTNQVTSGARMRVMVVPRVATVVWAVQVAPVVWAVPTVVAVGQGRDGGNGSADSSSSDGGAGGAGGLQRARLRCAGRCRRYRWCRWHAHVDAANTGVGGTGGAGESGRAKSRGGRRWNRVGHGDRWCWQQRWRR